MQFILEARRTPYRRSADFAFVSCTQTRARKRKVQYYNVKPKNYSGFVTILPMSALVLARLRKEVSDLRSQVAALVEAEKIRSSKTKDVEAPATDTTLLDFIKQEYGSRPCRASTWTAGLTGRKWPKLHTSGCGGSTSVM